MERILRTNSSNSDFVELVNQLDAYLSIVDGDEHSFYDQYNGINEIRYVVLFYKNEKAVGCGAIKSLDSKSMEVKRMYTSSDYRGKGIASKVLLELENWASELGFEKCILETGKRQVEAVEFYKKNGYQMIPNFGQYIGVENSICFEKKVT